jgi:hypothetical protein
MQARLLRRSDSQDLASACRQFRRAVVGQPALPAHVSDPSSSCDEICVVSYNILADMYSE